MWAWPTPSSTPGRTIAGTGGWLTGRGSTVTSKVRTAGRPGPGFSGLGFPSVAVTVMVAVPAFSPSMLNEDAPLAGPSTDTIDESLVDAP